MLIQFFVRMYSQMCLLFYAFMETEARRKTRK